MKGSQGAKLTCDAQGAKEELPEVEGEPLVQGDDEELLAVVPRGAQKGVDLLGQKRGQACPLGEFRKGEPLALAPLLR